MKKWSNSLTVITLKRGEFSPQTCRFLIIFSKKLRGMREELVNIYEICVKQNLIKSKIENGEYSNGRRLGVQGKGFVIPKKSKYPE